MLETQLILQSNLYKLTWHPKWRVPHQPLKQHIYRSDKVVKIKKYNIKNPSLLSHVPPPPSYRPFLHARRLHRCLHSIILSEIAPSFASSGLTSSTPPSPRCCHYASVSTPSLHASWVVHLQRNHLPLNLDLSSENIAKFSFSIFNRCFWYFDFPMKIKNLSVDVLVFTVNLDFCQRFHSGGWFRLVVEIAEV